MRKICCMCKKTEDSHGWEEQEPDRDSLVSHGYCPECFRQTMQRLSRMAKLNGKTVRLGE